MTVMTADHEPTRRGVRVIRAGKPVGASTTVTGPGHAVEYRDSEIARIDEMISGSDIVKLSDGDLAWLRPGDRHGEAIRWLMSRGPAILVVTDGHTATAYTRSGSVHIRGQRGAGTDTAQWEDAFVAGLLHALTARSLPARRADRNLRAIGLDDLRGVLHDANVSAARAVTPVAG